MTHAAIIVLAIFGLRLDWRPDACERRFVEDSARSRCEARRDSGAEWAVRLAGYIDREGDRQAMPIGVKVATVAVMMRERSLSEHDLCFLHMAASRILSRRPSPSVGMEILEWTFGTDRTNRQTVRVLEEPTATDPRFYLDTCPWDEKGLMQLSPWVYREGVVIPCTGERLPASRSERERIVSENEANVSLGMWWLAQRRDACCGDDVSCRDDWSRWMPAHNAHQCSGPRFRYYGDKIGTLYSDAVAYICQEAPESPVCPATSPGDDR